MSGVQKKGMTKFKRGVFWGRFNPPHKGHVAVIKHLLKHECDELIVAIGSALASHTERNPFSGGERLLMMRDCLRDENLLEKCLIVLVPDADNYATTAMNLRVACPPFDAVFTNRPVIADIFKQWGVAVRGFPDFDRGKLQSALARDALLNGKKLSEIVPPAVEKYLRENNGLQRLKTCREDKYA